MPHFEKLGLMPAGSLRPHEISSGPIAEFRVSSLVRPVPGLRTRATVVNWCRH